MCRIGIERYRLAHSGNRPKDLADLVPAYLQAIPEDPFDGKPLRYQHREKGYVVYCIGPDGKDDQGTRFVPRMKEGADIVVIVER